MVSANEEKDVLYINKVAIMQVLAGLIKNPLLFADNNYRFDIDDFQEQFHKIVFGAIEYLAKSGLQKIDYIDIDKFLQPYTAQYKVFTDNRGVEYIQKILQLYDDKKFNYYYHTLKKYSLLLSLNNSGISTLDIYDPNITNPSKQQKMQEEFDKMSVNDIILTEENKILDAKTRFGSNSDIVENNISFGLADLKEQYKKTPEMGMPFCSPTLTTLYRGQRLGCLVMDSGASGAGKTRRAISEACHLAVSDFYDIINKKWLQTGLHENVLVINTELELAEVQTMALAYIAGVPESHILDGAYIGDEESRVDRAIEALSKAHLYFVSITNFDCEDVIDIIKKYYQRYDVKYVYFDYLSESVKMLAEGARKTKISGLRTDQILLQFSTALKDCAKQLSIYIWTATQINNNNPDGKIADSSLLRGAKSLAEKTDCATIMLPVREVDQGVIDTYCAKGFEQKPNFIIHIYKLRRGSYQNIKVYVYFDRSTCRLYDCFVTDINGVLLPIEPTNVEVVYEQTKEEKFEKSYGQIDFDF